MISREDMRSSVDDGFAAEAVRGDSAFHFESVYHSPVLQFLWRVRSEGRSFLQTNVARFDSRRFHRRFQRLPADVVVDGVLQRRPPGRPASLEEFFNRFADFTREFELMPQEIRRSPAKMNFFRGQRLG